MVLQSWFAGIIFDFKDIIVLQLLRLRLELFRLRLSTLKLLIDATGPPGASDGTALLTTNLLTTVTNGPTPLVF